MAYLLIEDEIFEETNFSNENELENAFVKNKLITFGKDSVLIDYKRKIGAKNSKNTGIPDGFLSSFPRLLRSMFESVKYSEKDSSVQALSDQAFILLRNCSFVLVFLNLSRRNSTASIWPFLVA